MEMQKIWVGFIVKQKWIIGWGFEVNGVKRECLDCESQRGVSLNSGVTGGGVLQRTSKSRGKVSG